MPCPPPPSGSRRPGIEHDTGGHRFRLRVAGGEAHLDYVVRGTPPAITWDAVHTYVPPSARGQGSAARLTEAFVEAARLSGARVAGSCSYVGRWLEAHPDA